MHQPSGRLPSIATPTYSTRPVNHVASEPSRGCCFCIAFVFLNHNNMPPGFKRPFKEADPGILPLVFPQLTKWSKDGWTSAHFSHIRVSWFQVISTGPTQSSAGSLVHALVKSFRQTIQVSSSDQTGRAASAMPDCGVAVPKGGSSEPRWKSLEEEMQKCLFVNSWVSNLHSQLRLCAGWISSVSWEIVASTGSIRPDQVLEFLAKEERTTTGRGRGQQGFGFGGSIHLIRRGGGARKWPSARHLGK